MEDWTGGYRTDVAYTFGYYAELNPLRARLALLDAGLAPAGCATACELGFGQGLTVNLHAAASGTQWFGTDFNPTHARFAQDLVRSAGTSARLFDQSFEEFCTRADLPDFDFIGLHGIWSWVSDVNRAAIVDFVRRKLRAGGVLYIGYNTQPGWAGMVPIRDLLVEHHAVMSMPGTAVASRIEAALDFVEKLFATKPIYARAHPYLAEKLKKLKEQDRQYLAHEYFNRDWHPMSFAQFAQRLDAAKVTFACSANYLDHVDPVNLSSEQQALLKEIPDRMFRETIRDFCVNQGFRRDYWVKGAHTLSPLARVEALRAERVVLVKPRADVVLKITGALGEATLQPTVYTPILDTLADHKPRTIGQIEQAVREANVSIAQILQAAVVLNATGALATAQDDAAAAAASTTTQRLNAAISARARASGEVTYLASPVTGGGIFLGRFGELFLLARAQGRKEPAEWARFTWDTIGAQGQKIVKDGRTLQSAEENLAEVTANAQTFADKQLPILRGLGIA